MKKALIAYSTWAGATHEIAEEISKVFQSNSFDIDVVAANECNNIDNYDVILLGTSIHAGQTLKSFRNFIKQHMDVLIYKPTAVFIVCANMMFNSEDNKDETLAWLEKALEKYEKFNPISIGLFGGAILTNGEDFNKLNILIRKMITVMDKNIATKHGKSDFRNWELINIWAESVIKQLEM